MAGSLSCGQKTPLFMPRARTFDSLHFMQASQVSVTIPEAQKVRHGFISIAQYPRGFEPEDDEFGMIVLDGVIVERLFSSE
jgi:hypothetical protein